MKPLLVQIATTAVMIHMAVGCHWHHGLGASQACISHCETTCDHHVADDCHDHSAPLSEFSISEGTQSGHGHLGCLHDTCKVTQQSKFQFDGLDFSVQYIGGSESLAIIAAGSNQPQTSTWPLASCWYSHFSVRAHLAIGVQLL